MNLSITEYWLISLIISTSLVVLVVTLQLQQALKKLTQDPNAAPDTQTWWERFKGLKPLEQEKSLVMDHAYDGIVELDNPTPPWFMWLFYLTIGFAGIYLYYFELGAGPNQAKEYQREMELGNQEKEAYIKKFAASINEDNVKVLSGQKDLLDGASIYASNCVACHGDKGQGGVGPNLTDAYWLHGGKIKQVFHVITQGVPEKGMIAWNKTLNPLQIQKVASYVLSLKGSQPPGAKEPQGSLEP